MAGVDNATASSEVRECGSTACSGVRGPVGCNFFGLIYLLEVWRLPQGRAVEISLWYRSLLGSEETDQMK